MILLFLIVVLVALAFSINKKNKHQAEMSFVSYLITPPAFDEGVQTIDRFYLVLIEIINSKKNKSQKQALMSCVLEVIATKQDGISFMISCPIEISESVKSHLISYWPSLQIKKVPQAKSYRYGRPDLFEISEWKIKSRFYNDQNTEGCLGFIYGAMSGLKDSEFVGWQIIISPLNSQYYLKMIISKVIQAILSIGQLFLRIVIGIGVGGVNKNNSFKQALNGLDNRPNPKVNISIRSLCASNNQHRLNNYSMTIDSALRSNGLSKKIIINKQEAFKKYFSKKATVFYPVSEHELKRLYNFPKPSQKTRQEDLNMARSSILTAPTAVKNKKKMEVVLGMSNSAGPAYSIALNHSERQKHLYIIGGTGMGKSTILGYSFVQDMLSGKGVALIDPHGDLAQDMLGYVPSNRLKDVIYINPSDIRYPISINLLELDNKLNAEDLELAKDFIAESIVYIFRKVFSEDESGGHRVEYILRNVIHTAFTVPNATLFTLNKLLTNDTYRAGVVAKLTDDSLKDFWYGEFNKAGSYQRVKMIAGVTAKLGRFQRSIVSRRMLEQPNSSIDFKSLLDEGKILICNLSKGLIGEDTSALIGMVILAKLQLAVWQRSLIEVNKRKPFYLYVDEFQQFASPTFSTLVSESRKFGLFLTLAEQTSAYQNEKESNILLANVGNIICFRTSSEIDARLIGPIFEPYLNKLDFINLEPYKFYMRLSSELTNEPLSGETIKIKSKSNVKTCKKVIESSRSNYAKKHEEIPVSVSNKLNDRVPMKHNNMD